MGTRYALDEPFDPGKTGRFAVLSMNVKEALEGMAKTWPDVRARKIGAWMAWLISFKTVMDNILVIAKLTGMDVTPFRASQGVVEQAVTDAGVGKNSGSDYAPGIYGRVTLALKDAYMAGRELVSDARDLRTPDEKSYSYVAFGSDLGIIVSSLAMIVKFLRFPLGPFIKARNAVQIYFQIISDATLGAVPLPGGSVEEVPLESIVLASWVKRALLEFHRNPVKAAAMIEGLEKLLVKGS